jgi:hypothetical protein
MLSVDQGSLIAAQPAAVDALTCSDSPQRLLNDTNSTAVVQTPFCSGEKSRL